MAVTETTQTFLTSICCLQLEGRRHLARVEENHQAGRGGEVKLQEVMKVVVGEEDEALLCVGAEVDKERRAVEQFAGPHVHCIIGEEPQLGSLGREGDCILVGVCGNISIIALTTATLLQHYYYSIGSASVPILLLCLVFG